MSHAETSFGIIPFQKREGTWWVLLVLQHAGHWSFPKGRGLPGEEPMEAARRELKEETNLEIDHYLVTFPITERYRFQREGEWIDKTVLLFSASVQGQVKCQEEEIEEARWVTLDRALELLSFEDAKVTLRAAIRHLD